MLNFQEFFDACSGVWKTERIYHDRVNGEIERSFTEFRVNPRTESEKQQLLTPSDAPESLKIQQEGNFPGFAIAFDTVSETGERVSMSLKAMLIRNSE